MKTRLVSTVIFLCCLFIGTVQDVRSEEGNRMNVLFIAIDDLRPALGCYGDKIAVTPNIDRLAKQGTLFRRAYCQQSLCNPSRASVITGLRPDTLKVWNLSTHFRKHHPDVVTLPQLFKQHGYHTQSFGKILHGSGKPSIDAPSWTADPFQDHCSKRDQYVLAVNRPGETSGKQAAVESADVRDDAYLDGQLANKVIETIERLEAQGTPFFLGVGFRKPHLPCSAPKKYWDLHKRSSFENENWPARAKTAGGPAIALHNWKELRGYTDIPKAGEIPPTKAAEVRHGYYSAVSYTDAQVGKLLDALDRTGLRKNTILCLWSDHGFHLGEHTIWCKTSNYELDARVPLIISAPGKTSGQVCDRLVELVDMYPTVAELAELPTDARLEGTSMTPLLENPTQRWKKFALSQHPRPAYYGKNPRVMGYSLHTEQFHYIEWTDFDTKNVVAKELYDLNKDPHELFNVVDEDESKTVIGELSAQLKGGWRAALPPTPSKIIARE